MERTGASTPGEQREPTAHGLTKIYKEYCRLIRALKESDCTDSTKFKLLRDDFSWASHLFPLLRLGVGNDPHDIFLRTGETE